jgi:hypothetical protein
MNLREEMTGGIDYCVVKIFFKEIYYTENSARYTGLQNCSFNQFAIVVICRARNRVSTVLGIYKCSSEKQVQREKHCGK